MSDVTLHVYDLTRGLASQLSMQLIGEQLSGIWHTGIVVYNREFFFGGGIFEEKPGCTHFGRPSKVLPLGRTQVPEELLRDFLGGLAQSSFSATSYNLIQNNCNHFTNEVSTFLVGHGIPADIVGLPERLLATPLGQALAPSLAPLMGGYTSQSGGAREILPSAQPRAPSTSSSTTPDTSASPSTASTPPFIVFAAGSVGRIVPHLLEQLQLDGAPPLDQRQRATLHNLPSLVGAASGTLTTSERTLLTSLASTLPAGARTAPLDILRLLLAMPRHATRELADEAVTVGLRVVQEADASAKERLVALRTIANALAVLAATEDKAGAVVAGRAVAADCDAPGHTMAHRLAAASLAYNVSAVLPVAGSDEEQTDAEDDAVLSLLASLVEAASDAEPAGGALAHTLFVTLNRVVSRDAAQASFVAAFDIDFARHCDAADALERTKVAARDLATAVGTPITGEPAKQALPVGVVHEATSDSHVDELLSLAGSTPVIIDFSATWCGPCRAIAPTFTSLAAEAGASAVCLKVDVDKCPGAAARFSVQAMPTFVLLRGGVEASRVRGANSANL
eukprot:CAMPEP_0170751554 /NCGR_PEP_ID=MMETSP0437-20130122/11512_1 /TAXON_ID=0 /ORGANISM="Sexangularia sp." /LENGTH=565 /DNA_ID=CAMNT_0011090595 /DNA_START=123 /DNA_END=1817 /DNA_ORIENTATION=-